MSSVPVRLEGVLLDPDGQAVAGARVELVERRETTSDDQGRFAFEVAPGQHRLKAAKDDLYIWVAVNARAGREPVMLWMQRGPSLRVTVVGDDGPVANARILRARELVATTNEEGVAVVRGVRSVFEAFEIEADGYASAWISVTRGSDEQFQIEQAIRLRRGTSVSGVILAPGGAPIPGADVQLLELRCGASGFARSNDDGTWRIPAVTPGTYRVHATVDGVGGCHEQFVTVEAERPLDGVVVQLVPDAEETEDETEDEGAPIAGTVLDANGVPRAGWPVALTEYCELGDVTDSRGRFEIAGVPDGEHRLRPGPDRAVRAGETNVEIVLPATGSITGRVRVDGKPLEHFGVAIHGRFKRPVRTFHDRDGRFEIDNLAIGTTSLVIGGPGASRRKLVDIEVMKDEVVDLGDLELEPGRRVDGRVVDGAGCPVERALVRLGVPFFGHRGPIERWFDSSFETRTDRDGNFAFDGVDARWDDTRRALTVEADHPALGASYPVDAARDTRDVVLTLQPVGSIEGRVDRPVAEGAGVIAVSDVYPRSVYSTTVDELGRFELDRVLPGQYEVELVEPRKRPRNQAVTVTVVANQATTITFA